MFKNKNLYFVFAVAFIISSCASTKVIDIPEYGFQEDQAKLTITRPRKFTVSGIAARIKINGTKVGEIANNDEISIGVPEGPGTITVGHWQYPGEFSLTINFEKDKHYYVLLNPKGQLANSIGFGLAGIIGFYAAANIDKSNNPNGGGGPFEMALVKITDKKGNVIDEVKSLETDSEKNKSEQPIASASSEEYCSKIGYKSGTEKYADCIMKMMDKN